MTDFSKILDKAKELEVKMKESQANIKKIRAEGVLRTIYLYPMALSFIVTGTAWKWVMNPTLGIEKFFIDIGFENFTFDWLVTPGMSIYCIVIAGVWQSSGFIMAIFLA